MPREHESQIERWLMAVGRARSHARHIGQNEDALALGELLLELIKSCPQPSELRLRQLIATNG